MPIEQERDDVARAFQESYQHLVEQTPIASAEWPPAPTVLRITNSLVRRAWSGWQAAVAGFLLTGAFGIGWLAAPSPGIIVTDPFEVQSVTVTAIGIPVPDSATAKFTSPFDAAIAAAIAQDPNLVDPHVTRLIGIYADDQSVDFRALVEADGFCHWYGVTGRVQDGALAWRTAPALACGG